MSAGSSDVLMQSRIAEYFGVSESMILARGRRRRHVLDEDVEGNIVEDMKKMANETYDE
jgi:hypothetical protein